ncbi:MAG: NAD(P)H nitroreductase [Mycobacterium sp.]
MTASRLNDDTVHAALELANRAPSVSTSQSWRWRVGAHSVHLYTEISRQLPPTDPDGRAKMISCGAALHHCVTAFAALGWRAIVHRFPNPAEPDHLAAVELHRAAPSATDVALAGAIHRRRTDRRPFTDSAVGLDDVAVMGARAARLGVTLRRLEPAMDFSAALAQAVWTHLDDPGYLQELTACSGRHASDEGNPARSALSPDPAAALPGRLFAGPALMTPTGPRNGMGNGVLMVLGTGADDAVARLRAGEATSAVLLTATARGLASCLIPEPLEAAETRRGVQELAFENNQIPQMLLRAGWAHQARVARPQSATAGDVAIASAEQ